MSSSERPDDDDLGSAASDAETRLAKNLSSSVIWSIANNIATNGITLVVFIFLTYKLNAAVFGIFALGVIIVDYFNFQARSACLDATIQRRLYSKLEMDSVFWAMMGVTVIVIIVCGSVASWMARANGEPTLALVMPALALTLLVVPLAVPPNAVMMRDYDFRGGAIRGIIGAMAGGAAALAIVFSPFPEWALVAQRGTQVTVHAIIMAARVRWWPGLGFSLPVATGFLKDAGRIFAGQAVASSNMRVLDLVVAFAFGAAAVGLMRVASRFVDILYGTFIAPVSTLWILLLSEKNQKSVDRDLIYRRLSQVSALIALPIFGGLALISADLIKLTLSDEYASASGILTILCIVGLFAPLTYFRNAAFIAVKRLNLLIAYSLLDLAIVITLAISLAEFSAEAVVFSLVIMEAVRLVLTVPVLLKDMKTTALSLFLSVAPAYAATALMAAGVWLVGMQTIDLDPMIRLALKIIMGGVIYAGYLLVFHRNWSITAINFFRARSSS